MRDTRVNGAHGGPKLDRALDIKENLHVVFAALVGPELRGVAQVERCPGDGGGNLKPMLSRQLCNSRLLAFRAL